MLRRTLAIAVAAVLAGCSQGFRFNDLAFTDLRESVDREERHALDLNAGDALSLDTPYGRIEAEASSDGKPELRALFRARGRDAKEAEELLKRYSVKIERSGSELRVRVEGEPLETTSGPARIRIEATVDLTVSVPKGTALRAHAGSGAIVGRGPFGRCDLDSGFGSVTLRDADGEVDARSGSGSITLGRIRGDRVRAKSGFGAVRCSELKAKEVFIESTSGSVEAEGVSADSIELKSSFGRIDIVDVSGNIAARTSSGTVSLKGAGKGEHTLESGFGAVEVHRASGRLRAKTSSGSVRIDGFEGAVDAESQFGSVAVEGVLSQVDAVSQSGNVEVAAQRGSRAQGAWQIRSGFGSLRLEIPSEFACELDAETRFGVVRFDGQAEMPEKTGKRNVLRARVDGGGETVKLRTDSGGIRITRS